MNEWGALFWLASVAAVFSIPFLILALLMRLVGRPGTRSLIAFLSVDSILWEMAFYFWSLRTGL